MAFKILAASRPKLGNSVSNLYSSPSILVPSIVKYGIKATIGIMAIVEGSLSDKVSSVEGIAPEGNAGYVMPALSYITAFAMLYEAYQISNELVLTTLKKLSVLGFSMVALLDAVNASLTIVAKSKDLDSNSNEVESALYLGAVSVVSFGLYSASQVIVKGQKFNCDWSKFLADKDLNQRLRGLSMSSVTDDIDLRDVYGERDGVQGLLQDLGTVQLDLVSRDKQKMTVRGVEVATNLSIVSGELAILSALFQITVSTESVVMFILFAELMALLGTCISMLMRNKQSQPSQEDSSVNLAMNRLLRVHRGLDQQGAQAVLSDVSEPALRANLQRDVVERFCSKLNIPITQVDKLAHDGEAVVLV